MAKKNKHKVFIIAEAGVNHNGRLDQAKALVKAALWAGADAIKFQSFFVEENYSVEHTHKKRWQWAKSLEFGRKTFKKLADYCDQQGIMFLSTPFDRASVQMLDEFGMPLFKIASSEVCNFPLLKYTAATGKPILLSTGMATEKEINQALDVIGRSSKVSLLYCVSLYPAPYDKVDLNRIPEMAKTFGMPVGFSDHSVGIGLPIAAVGLGAKIIEKHLKLSDDTDCPDAAVSLNTKEFKQMVDFIRHVESALGPGDFFLSKEEIAARQKIRKGFFAARTLKSGALIGDEDIVLKKPSGEIGLEYYFDIIGNTLTKDIEQGEPLRHNHLKRRLK